jgi:hypothetical protein
LPGEDFDERPAFSAFAESGFPRFDGFDAPY